MLNVDFLFFIFYFCFASYNYVNKIKLKWLSILGTYYLKGFVELKWKTCHRFTAIQLYFITDMVFAYYLQYININTCSVSQTFCTWTDKCIVCVWQQISNVYYKSISLFCHDTQRKRTLV